MKTKKIVSCDCPHHVHRSAICKHMIKVSLNGMWENTNNSGYIYWCNVKSEIGEETKLVGSVPYYIKRKFGFSRLIKYVGDRMMDIVRKHEPYATEKDLKKYLNEIAVAMK